eukprot:GHVR01132229.1.p1 GENE.GHVR01132229.1~~GHVR01132229.1.p1  ORF type:complete len:427 (+),score=68.90 GHVR01132229.1:206-1486(+)
MLPYMLALSVLLLIGEGTRQSSDISDSTLIIEEGSTDNFVYKQIEEQLKNGPIPLTPIGGLNAFNLNFQKNESSEKRNLTCILDLNSSYVTLFVEDPNTVYDSCISEKDENVHRVVDSSTAIHTPPVQYCLMRNGKYFKLLSLHQDENKQSSKDILAQRRSWTSTSLELWRDDRKDINCIIGIKSTRIKNSDVKSFSKYILKYNVIKYSNENGVIKFRIECKNGKQKKILNIPLNKMKDASFDMVWVNTTINSDLFNNYILKDECSNFGDVLLSGINTRKLPNTSVKYLEEANKSLKNLSENKKIVVDDIVKFWDSKCANQIKNSTFTINYIEKGFLTTRKYPLEGHIVDRNKFNKREQSVDEKQMEGEEDNPWLIEYIEGGKLLVGSKFLEDKPFGKDFLHLYIENHNFVIKISSKAGINQDTIM